MNVDANARQGCLAPYDFHGNVKLGVMYDVRCKQ